MERAIADQFFNPALAAIPLEKRIDMAGYLTRNLPDIVSLMPLSDLEKREVHDVAKRISALIDERVGHGARDGEDSVIAMKVMEFALQAALEHHREARRGMAIICGEAAVDNSPINEGDYVSDVAEAA